MANSYWNGYGLADKDFAAANGKYTSYKLALDLIVWRDLDSNANTASFANGYGSEMNIVTSIMSQLQ